MFIFPPSPTYFGCFPSSLVDILHLVWVGRGFTHNSYMCMGGGGGDRIKIQHQQKKRVLLYFFLFSVTTIPVYSCPSVSLDSVFGLCTLHMVETPPLLPVVYQTTWIILFYGITDS